MTRAELAEIVERTDEGWFFTLFRKTPPQHESVRTPFGLNYVYNARQVENGEWRVLIWASRKQCERLLKRLIIAEKEAR